jgi:hypothetical protein
MFACFVIQFQVYPVAAARPSAVLGSSALALPIESPAAHDIVSIDFSTVPTATFRVVFVFLVLDPTNLAPRLKSPQKLQSVLHETFVVCLADKRRVVSQGLPQSGVPE